MFMGNVWLPYNKKRKIESPPLDKYLIPRYHDTMNTIATNVRFPADEYRELKLLAFAQEKSMAFLIRKAVSFYTKRKLTVKLQVSLAEKLKNVSVNINVPTLELVKEGRRFE